MSDRPADVTRAFHATRSAPEHGKELARALLKHGVAFDVAPPPDAVISTDLAAANLRCFFGRQLRAWGEAESAGLLRRVPDARIKQLRAEQEKLGTIAEPESVNIVRRELGVDAEPLRRKRPTPALFQYHALHGPFFSRKADGVTPHQRTKA